MQNIRFNSIREFMDFLSQDELDMVGFLRDMIFRCMPDAKEKLAYNVPYYRRHRNICFIWPSSVFWGHKQTYSGVRFGFINGFLLTDPSNYLERGNRKQVYWKDFIEPADVNQDLLQALLFEAILLDEEAKLKN